MMSDFAQAVTAMAVGTAVGLLCVGAGARALDAWESSQCPGVTRVQVNRSPWFKDFTAYGMCPRQGLTAPLKP